MQHSFQLLSSSLSKEQKAFMELQQQQFINSHMINSGLCWVQENSAEAPPQRILLLTRSSKEPEECFPAWQLSADQCPPAQARGISLLALPVVPGLAGDVEQAGKPTCHRHGMGVCHSVCHYGHTRSPCEPTEHPQLVTARTRDSLQPGSPEEQAVPH